VADYDRIHILFCGKHNGFIWMSRRNDVEARQGEDVVPLQQ